MSTNIKEVAMPKLELSKEKIVEGVRRLTQVVREELADHRAPVEI